MELGNINLRRVASVLVVVAVVMAGVYFRAVRDSGEKRPAPSKSRPTVEVGVVWQEVPTEHRLRLANRGHESRTIVDSFLGCPCAQCQLHLPCKLDPGAAQVFRILWSGADIRTNGDRFALAVTMLGADGRRWNWWLTGTQRRFFDPAPGQSLVLPVADFPIANSWRLHLADGVTPVGARSESPDLHLDLSPADQNRVWTLTAEYRPTIAAGDRTIPFVIDSRDRTTDDSLPPALLTVEWTPLIMTPRDIRCDPATVGTAQEYFISVHSPYYTINHLSCEARDPSTKVVAIEDEGAHMFRIQMRQRIESVGNQQNSLVVSAELADSKQNVCRVKRVIPVWYYGISGDTES